MQYKSNAFSYLNEIKIFIIALQNIFSSFILLIKLPHTQDFKDNSRYFKFFGNFRTTNYAIIIF